MTDPMDDLRQSSAEVSGVEVLSPAAQAVMVAATNGNTNVVNDPVYRQCIAAALRAAADQVAPLSGRLGKGYRQHRSANAERLAIRRELLAIAAELEGHQ